MSDPNASPHPLEVCFTGTEKAVVSATVFEWTPGEPEGDECVLVVGDSVTHIDLTTQIMKCVAARAHGPVTFTFLSRREAEKELCTPGSPLTEIRHVGRHLAGTPLAALVADQAPYDPEHVKLRAHEISRSWVQRIRNPWKADSSGRWLALLLEGSAAAALMHHREARLTDARDDMPTQRGLRRLARHMGDANAQQVATLILELRAQEDTDCSDWAEEVHRLVEIMMVVASDSDAPGCTLG